MEKTKQRIRIKEADMQIKTDDRQTSKHKYIQK